MCAGQNARAPGASRCARTSGQTPYSACLVAQDPKPDALSCSFSVHVQVERCGFAHHLPNLDPVHPLTSLKLVPVVSGYRDAATKKVVFTTSYKDMEQKIAQIQDESSGSAVVNDKFNPLRTDVWELFLSESSTARIDVEDFGVVLPWAEIESLTIFDPNIYNAFEDVDSSADNVSANVAPREAASASHEATSGDHQAASAHLLSSPEHILSAAGPTRQHSRTRRRRMRITTAPRHGARPRHRSAGQHSGTLTLTASPPWDVSL